MASLLVLAAAFPSYGGVAVFELRFEGLDERPAELRLKARDGESREASLLVKVEDDRGLSSLDDEPRNGEGPWQLTCADEAFWCEGEWRRGAEPVRLTVFAAGQIEGSYAGRAPLPGSVALQAWAALDEHLELTFSQEVDLEDRRFITKVPVIPLDLRLALDGWAPAYVWELRPRRGEKVETGPLPLRAGASLCAFVVEENGLPAVGAKI
ncbi:MAG: hypothetical protein AAFY88_16620, partial [Acidobacteriota bacterium]